MLEQMEKATHVSVSRACGFALIAIVTFMVGLLAGSQVLAPVSPPQ